METFWSFDGRWSSVWGCFYIFLLQREMSFELSLILYMWAINKNTNRYHPNKNKTMSDLTGNIRKYLWVEVFFDELLSALLPLLIRRHLVIRLQRNAHISMLSAGANTQITQSEDKTVLNLSQWIHLLPWPEFTFCLWHYVLGPLYFLVRRKFNQEGFSAWTYTGSF